MTDPTNARSTSTALVPRSDQGASHNLIDAPAYRPLPPSGSRPGSSGYPTRSESLAGFGSDAGTVAMARRYHGSIATRRPATESSGTFVGFSSGLVAGVASGLLLIVTHSTVVDADRLSPAGFAPEPIALAQSLAPGPTDSSQARDRNGFGGVGQTPAGEIQHTAALDVAQSREDITVARFAVTSLAADQRSRLQDVRTRFRDEFGSSLQQREPSVGATMVVLSSAASEQTFPVQRDTLPIAVPLDLPPAARDTAATPSVSEPPPARILPAPPAKPAERSAKSKTVTRSKVVKRRFKPASRGNVRNLTTKRRKVRTRAAAKSAARNDGVFSSFFGLRIRTGPEWANEAFKSAN